jgi:hypothetical protein
MSKHTPGPWTAQSNGHYGFIIEHEGSSIAAVWGQKINMNATPLPASANACLIAAAPDLLEALKGVIAVADRKTNEFDAARAAIAKATGEK